MICEVAGEDDLAVWVRIRNAVEPHEAAAHGYRDVETWTQNGNDAMRAANDRVGYRSGHIAITVRGPSLP